jgi:hypothetical protein
MYSGAIQKEVDIDFVLIPITAWKTLEILVFNELIPEIAEFQSEKLINKTIRTL